MKGHKNPYIESLVFDDNKVVRQYSIGLLINGKRSYVGENMPFVTSYYKAKKYTSYQEASYVCRSLGFTFKCNPYIIATGLQFNYMDKLIFKSVNNFLT